jgi:hypothetical protein
VEERARRGRKKWQQSPCEPKPKARQGADFQSLSTSLLFFTPSLSERERDQLKKSSKKRRDKKKVIYFSNDGISRIDKFIFI